MRGLLLEAGFAGMAADRVEAAGSRESIWRDDASAIREGCQFIRAKADEGKEEKKCRYSQPCLRSLGGI